MEKATAKRSQTHATRKLPEPTPKEESAPVVEVEIDRIIKYVLKDSFLVGMAGDPRERNETLPLLVFQSIFFHAEYYVTIKRVAIAP